MVLLFNAGNEPFRIHSGDRIAQMLFQKVEAFDWEEVDAASELDGSLRGEGGFGSTGLA